MKIIRDGVTHELGRFDTIEEARAARDAYPDRRKAALDKRRATLAKAETARQWKAFLLTPTRQALQDQLDISSFYQIRLMVAEGAALVDACKVAGMTAAKYSELVRQLI